MPPLTSECYQLTLPEGWTPPKYQLGQKVLVQDKCDPLDLQDFAIVTGLSNNSLIAHPSRDGHLPGWDYTVTFNHGSPMWATYGDMGIFSEDELSPNS